jgi:hypothetical protein
MPDAGDTVQDIFRLPPYLSGIDRASRWVIEVTQAAMILLEKA